MAMLNAVVVLLGGAVLLLSVIAIDLTRRIRAIEKLFVTACEALGDPQYE